MPEVADSLVVHLEDAEGGPGELILFVVLTPGERLNDELRTEIALALRGALSPRHVPDTIEAVPAIPRTLTAKKLELPVKRILLGAKPEEVASRDALAEPGALDAFVEFAAARGVRSRLAGAPVDDAHRLALAARDAPGSSTRDARSGCPCARAAGGSTRTAERVGVGAGSRLALERQLVHRAGSLDDQLVVRRDALGTLSSACSTLRRDTR